MNIILSWLNDFAPFGEATAENVDRISDALNSLGLASRSFDPYPYVFFNLLLAILVALQGPLIVMSQNRQTLKDIPGGTSSDVYTDYDAAGRKWSAIKATEGTGYVDPDFRARWNELGQKVANGQMKLRVAYHFMSPGDGVGQAKHFLQSLGINGPLQAGTRLALDWEASALNDPGALRDAANYIHQVTGIWPLIYTSASQVPRATQAVPNAPLWVAKWSSNIPTNVPFVQYSDGPGYDHDVFNGDEAALARFAGF